MAVCGPFRRARMALPRLKCTHRKQGTVPLHFTCWVVRVVGMSGPVGVYEQSPPGKAAGIGGRLTFIRLSFPGPSSASIAMWDMCKCVSVQGRMRPAFGSIEISPPVPRRTGRSCRRCARALPPPLARGRRAAATWARLLPRQASAASASPSLVGFVMGFIGACVGTVVLDIGTCGWAAFFCCSE